MKRSLLMFFACLSVGMGFSQTHRFVEVLVQDTIHVPGSSFSYVVNIMPEEYWEEAREDQAHKLIRQEELKALVTAYNGELLDQTNKFQVQLDHSDNGERVILALFSNVSALEGFVKQLGAFNNVVGYLHHVDVDPDLNTNAVLNKKLLDKATVAASDLAAVWEVDLGEVLEVSEVLVDDDAVNWNLNRELGWTAYAPSSILAFSQNIGAASFVVFKKGMRVRYRILD